MRLRPRHASPDEPSPMPPMPPMSSIRRVRGGQFQARVWSGGQRYNLGLFSGEAEARVAVNSFLAGKSAAAPDEPTPAPGDRNDKPCPECKGRGEYDAAGAWWECGNCSGTGVVASPGYDPDSDDEADVYRRFVFSAQVLGLSLLALGAITLVMLAWVRVFAGH